MAQLPNKIRAYLGREVDFSKDVLLQNDTDGKGDYIKEWNVDEAQPTDEQLNALEAKANKLEINNLTIATRKSLYGTPEEQIESIMENGLDFEIARVNQIKLENPKG